MRADQIRKSFVDFFAGRGHTEVASGSLVPADDPTLLFTNAGMVQFKRVFQGLEHRDYRRAVTVQKCVRAGGKHNDLEQVGHTARHHTFFEMLGNFSFGDYFKREAIAFAWEWVTSEEFLGIHPDRLFFTVHHTDEEARRLWCEITGVPEDRVYRLGDKDNFWQMGDTGPCGPCSEVFVDLRNPAKRTRSLPQDEFEDLGERGDLLEIWNLVFMQFDQAKDGTRTPLPAPSVDTGAGLERIAAVMQGVPSNFDTELFHPLVRAASDIIGVEYDHAAGGVGFRVLADHARAVTFLLADGVYPSNDGRGYVLRRILRRAVRHAYLLGRTKPTLMNLTGVVIDQLGGVYPELRENAAHIQEVTAAEEERFLDTIEDGLRRLDELTQGSAGTIRGEDAFKLLDTYGFPIDLTVVIASERGWTVDVAGFETALERQREASRRSHDGADHSPGGGGPYIKRVSGSWTTVAPRKRQRFVGYDEQAADTSILKFRRDPERLDLMLHESPFYLESGGQVSDTGIVRGEGWELVVDDVIRVDGRQAVTGKYQGPFEATPVEARIDVSRRQNIERNHTATHLVHAALRAKLGTHVRQAGSVVDPNRLRFDFSHHAPIDDDDLRAVEEMVNEGVWSNTDIETHEMPYRAAIEHGAMALFGEKYGDIVRVVDIPERSVELCGGTHVANTGQIGMFRFVSESGVAAGVRRIEAVTGPAAYALVRALERQLNSATNVLRTTPEHLARRAESLLQDNKNLQKRVEELLRASGGGDSEFSEQRVGDVSLFIGQSVLSDRGQIGTVLDAFRGEHTNAIAALFTTGDRPGIHVTVTDDLVARGIKAGDLVNRIARVSGGRGGGRPHFASAGAGDPSKIEDAKSQVPDIVGSVLAGA